MTNISYSTEAILDLTKIADYTINKWGIAQSRKYRDGLNDTFKALLSDKYLGRSADEYYPLLRAYPYESHIVFYIPSNNGILIVRILGQKMDLGSHM